MDYKRTYQLLIDKRRNNPLPDGENGEVHHIVPRSEGGSDEPDNLVKLTAREHYVAHLLLARIYNDFKMWSAVWRMTTSKRIRMTSHIYELARRNRSKVMSNRMKQLAQDGEIDYWKYSQLGKKRSAEQKQALSKRMIGNMNGSGTHNISSEGRARISAANKGKKRSAETCKRIALSAKGRTPPNKGKAMSEEQKEKLRQANLGKKQSEETKRKRNAKLKGHPSYTAGMKWWNNGTEQRMCRECPEGWVEGRLKKKKEAD